MNRPKLSLILGSGFSAQAKVPTTKKLSDEFLKEPSKTELSRSLEKKISSILKEFWVNSFGYSDGNIKPSLEDHFTMLDLAANSGHHLGKFYSPKMLRAIRRMSIHRVFQILDINKRNKTILALFEKLTKHFNLSIVNLNWDIVTEKHLKSLGYGYDYCIETKAFKSTENYKNKIPILKVHGSSNWVYCDSCRRLYVGLYSKSALRRKTFLEEDDFKLFKIKRGLTSLNVGRKGICSHCNNQLAGRVATFSYRKAFSIAQFQTVWEQAYARLREASLWLFIGYSMPEADFEFKHLLKSAQLARRYPRKWTASVILLDDDLAERRYKGFFGEQNVDVENKGLKIWADKNLDRFIKMHR